MTRLRSWIWGVGDVQQDPSLEDIPNALSIAQSQLTGTT